MLQKLIIQNYAIIDNIEINFHPDLNIITGETGAGKSILLGALALLLGQRADTKNFYSQTKKCIIEGQFLLDKKTFLPLFESLDLDYEPQSLLRREISAEGKSRAFINDTPVSLAILKNISEKLIAIHTQHATLELNQADFQFLILDSIAQSQETFTAYQAEFKMLKKLQHELAERENLQTESLKRQDYETFLYQELVEAKLLEEEQDHLEAELNRLKHVESIQSGLYAVSQLLSEQEPSVQHLIKESLYQLQQIEKFDESLANYAQRIQGVFIEIKDMASDLERLQQQYHINPERVEEIEQRLDIIYSLEQKHRVNSIQELLLIQKDLENSLQKQSDQDQEIESLRKKIKEVEKSTHELAERLSQQRKAIIPEVCQAILEKLLPLQLPHAKLDFELSHNPDLGKYGYDQIQLLFTANPGQDPMPVSKVASGGELSRLMLAIKAVLAQHTQLATLVFDEIDTGISGEAAQKVANLLAELGQFMQLITITHLPQIAAKGEAHFLVYKDQKGSSTHTYMKKLDKEERIFSLAQMLSGAEPSSSALAHAKTLING